MTRIQKLRKTINQNPVARILLYLATLIPIVVLYFSFDKFAYCPIEMLDYREIMWLGFYGSVNLLWACNNKLWEWILNGILVTLNLAPIWILLFGAFLIEGFWGFFLLAGMVLVPFFNFGGVFSIFGDWDWLVRFLMFLAIAGLVLYLNGDWQERWNKNLEENNKEEMV